MHGMQLREIEMFSENKKEKWSLDKLPYLAMPNVSLKASDDISVGKLGFPQATHPTQNGRKMSQELSWSLRARAAALTSLSESYQPAVTMCLFYPRCFK